ncbi:hypothetical protein BKA93DRAFT_820700 [Sparassis latifolia]
MSPTGVFIRSTINETPESGSHTLAAFSPDIVPLGDTHVPTADIAVTYDHFIAHEVEPNERNSLIYVRGRALKSTQVDTVISLRAVQNELILWPQIWEQAPVVGETVLHAKHKDEVVVSEHPIKYRHPQDPHRHDAFVAISKDAPGPVTLPSARVENWRDLVKVVGNDPSITLYNVVFADPLSAHVTLNTRFRLFENVQKTVKLAFVVEACTYFRTPHTGLEASLSFIGALPDNSNFSFKRPRVPLHPSSTDTETTIDVPAGVDGTLTLEVFNPQELNLGNDTSVSVAVYAVISVQGAEDHVLLGAEHVIFDANTRVKKLLRRHEARAVKASARVKASVFAKASAQSKESTDTSSDTYPFYFRCSTSDGPTFPREGITWHSPDIQPLGTAPDGNVLSDLGSNNYTVDVSSQKQINTVQGTSNYIYIRGTTTTTDHTSGQIRLFAVPSSVLLHPSQYVNYSINDYDEDGEPYKAIRKYSTSAAEKPLIITKPFNHNNPTPPSGADHWCYISECRPDGEDENGDEYEWPHEYSGDFATCDEFATWIRNQPYVIQRNTSFVTNPDADSQHFRTCFTIPTKFSKKDQFAFQVRAINCPVGSEFSMDSDDADIQLGKTTVANSDVSSGPNFSGKEPGYSCQVNIHWYAKGTTVKSGQRLEGNLVHKSKVTSAAAQKSKKNNLSTSSKAATFTVGHDYPNLKASETKGPKKIGGAFVQLAAGAIHSRKAAVYEEILIGSDILQFKSS